MDLQFFWKNVNKQLKSADFLSETSKFWKILLNKVLAFLIQMSDHTLVFVVQPPNSQKPHTSTHVLLFSTTSKQTCQRVWDQLDNVPCSQIWYDINQTKKFTQRNIGKKSNFYKSPKKSKNFYLKTDQKFSVFRDIL